MFYFIILLLTPFAIFLAVYIPNKVVQHKYTKFIIAHSTAIKQIDEINTRYVFKDIPDMDLTHSYDNENMYDDISCKDYLTYNLVHTQKKVNKAMKDTLDNKNLFERYQQEIKEKCVVGKYDTDELLKNKKRLLKYENRLFIKRIQMPDVGFDINVNLKLTNINGVFKDSKQYTFEPKEIKDIIFKLNQKRGSFYMDNDIWQSICRVERGKVTNKMRFAIYERDHHRCRNCGRRTNDLEIDHIIPIAKGGKSNYENLQTLCHRCNVKKGSSMDY